MIGYFGNGGNFGHFWDGEISWGIGTSVVCQKRSRIFAGTSVFFCVLIFLRMMEVEILGSLEGKCLAGGTPLLYRSFGIIDLGRNSFQIFEE